MRELFGAALRRRTWMMVVFHILQTLGYYGFGTLVPLVLAAKGYAVSQSLLFAALTYLGYPVGSALSLPIVERVERKFLVIGSVLAMAVFGIAFGYAGSMVWILVFGFLYTATSNVFSNAYHIYQAEIFPTALRSTASSGTYSLSRLASGAMPFVLVPLLDSHRPDHAVPGRGRRAGGGRGGRRGAGPAHHRPPAGERQRRRHGRRGAAAASMTATASSIDSRAVSTTRRSRVHGSYSRSTISCHVGGTRPGMPVVARFRAAPVFRRVRADDLGFQHVRAVGESGVPPGIAGDGEGVDALGDHAHAGAQQVGGDVPGDDVPHGPERLRQGTRADDRLLDRVDAQERKTGAAGQFRGDRGLAGRGQAADDDQLGRHRGMIARRSPKQGMPRRKRPSIPSTRHSPLALTTRRPSGRASRAAAW